jgi:hypothetical protein
MSRCLTEQIGNIRSWKFATIKYGFKHCSCFWPQYTKTRFFLGPKQNTRPQAIELHEGFHEGHLVKADLKEEAGKCSERFLDFRVRPNHCACRGRIAQDVA